MTDNLDSGPSLTAVEEQPRDDVAAMGNADDQLDTGITSRAHINPVSGDGPSSDPGLRKRKRDVTVDPATASHAHSDHFESLLGHPAEGRSHSQPMSYNPETKRTKVESFATQSVAHPDSRFRVPSSGSGLPGEMELPVDRATPGVAKYVHPNSIWAASRKLFHTGMPRPLFSIPELEMWRLLFGTVCQFCTKHDSTHVSGATPWESGPGENGVRIIWPLGVRACGECLQKHCEKEMDLLFSSTVPSLLVPAIPFAFFTPSMHYVSASSLRGPQPPPGLLSLTKYYSKAQIEEMKRKFEDVKSLGPATAEEWVKGLEGDGKAKMADAARWEQWELTGGLRALQSVPHHECERASPPTIGFHTSDSASTNDPACVTNGRPTDALHSPTQSNTLDMKPPAPSSPDSDKGAQSSSHPNNRGERSIQQVNEAKASRRAEIENRCLALDPPLMPSVLNHMDSFTAAIQIPHPFSDRDWGILKPRLLNQRDMAERREQERIVHEQQLQAKSEERKQQEAQLREAKENLDREWEEVQTPVRERMASHADEIIREGWRGGDSVTKEKCPKFAADVLIYVRDKFYDNLTKEDALARAQGKPIEEDAPNAPPKRKLILENMKYIFDTKIKPLTEPFQKELFLCNGCENNSKFYGFEGVVQHYAAKHTSVLSLGSVVVHWRSEWPEQPPFHPNPNAAKALMYAMPRPVMGQSQMYSNQPPMYPHGPDPGHPLPPEGYPQPSPGRFSRTPYGTPYGYGTGPYRPPSPNAAQFYPGQQHAYGYSPPQHAYAANGPPPPSMYGSPYPGPAYQPPPYPPPYAQAPHSQSHNAPYGGGQQGSRRGGPHQQNSNSFGFGIHQPQIDEVAKTARSLWNGTSGIKDLPHNVRAQVLVHHVVARFNDKFSHEPPLPLFADALNRHQQMKPIRNLSGLACKSCVSGPDNRRMRGDGKKYTLPALISHFMSVHGESCDWKVDMLALPSDATVANLVNAPGMDEAKLKLVAEAFFWVFPSSHSSVASGETPPGDKPGLKRPDRSRPHEHPRIKQERHPKPKPGRSGQGPPGLEVAVDDFPSFVESPPADGQPLEPPRDDEYDPHRPSFVNPSREDGGDVDDYSRSRAARHKPSLPIHEKHKHGQSSAEPAITRAAPLGYSAARSRGAREALVGREHLVDERPGSRLRNVSEDGEVAEPAHAPPPHSRAEHHAEEMSAAERFLSNFDPGQERADFHDVPRESDQQFDRRERWVDAASPGDRQYRKEAGYEGTAEKGNVGTAVRGAPHSWRGHTNSPGSRGFHDASARRDALDPNLSLGSRRAEDVTPDPTESRHGKRHAAFPDSGPQGRRPQSRFDRYEAQRQNSLRPRSKSPAAHDPVQVDAAYYRDRSPPRARARQRPMYASQPSEPYVERPPPERATYGRIPSQAQQYHYVDDPRYAEPSYEGPVDYIPVRVATREPQNPGTYYIERPMPREASKEYVDYEMEYQHQPVYDQPMQGYPSGGVARDAHGMPGTMSRRSRHR